MGKVRARVVVTGLVQGVFFRANTERMARGLDVKGWVKNNPDGTVEAVFEGEEAKVKAAIEWCREGPITAQVDKVDVVREEYHGEFDAFHAISGYRQI